MANIVLVHGAFHGAWCWRDLTRRLRSEGHDVFPVTLTGLGERAHLIGPDVDLDTHIADVTGVIEAEELEAVVLLGHSYGGMPITGAADRMPERVGALVYLDAHLPDDGQSAMEIRSAEPGFVPLKEPEDGVSMESPPVEVFGLSGDLAAWARRRLTPHPYRTVTQPIHLSGAWRKVATKLYIRMADFPAPYFDRFYEETAASDDWAAIRRDGAHNVMMTEPDWLHGVLREHVL
jgi:pimeloyl-ACP methyl ester carboxylesterase